MTASAGAGEARHWDFEVAGYCQRVGVHAGFESTTINTLVDAALAGWVVTRVFSYQLADHLRDRRLIELCPGFDDRLVPVHLVHAEGRFKAAKIRAFVDAAAKNLHQISADWIS
ncbi:MAG: LysR substrate-binding domain-containing protein [Pseudomonadota bacterium]